MENKKISVIVPIYNKEDYLLVCIDSILKQTYSNLEIILVDDGSTDSSKAICEKKAKEDKRILYFNTRHTGAGAARNLGLEKSTGEFISFIDADDYIVPNYYRIMMQMIETTQSDLAECAFRRIQSKEEIEDKDNVEVKVLSNVEKLMELYGEDEDIYVNSVIMCNKLFKKELFKNIAYPLNRLIDDEFIIYKLIYNCKKVVTTNQVLYGYIQSHNSVMRGKFVPARVYDIIDVYDGVYEFFLNKNVEELKQKILIRYLTYGIELIEKTMRSTIEDKITIVEYLKIKMDEKWKIVMDLYQGQDILNKCEKIYQQFCTLYAETKK